MSSAIRTTIILLCAGLVGLLAYGVTATLPDRSVDNALARGQLSDPPPFDLEILSGGTGPLGEQLSRRLRPAAADGRLTLRELRGTPVVLNVWASWCTPCRQEAPVLERGWERVRDSGMLVLGLNVLDNRPNAREFIRDVGMSYPSVREPTNDTAKEFGTVGVPETYFLTREGKIAARVIGAISEEQFVSGVEAARTGRALVVQEGGARRSAP